MLLHGLFYLRSKYLHLFLLSFSEIQRRIHASNLLRFSCTADLSSIISTILPNVEASVDLMNIQSLLLLLIVLFVCLFYLWLHAFFLCPLESTFLLTPLFLSSSHAPCYLASPFPYTLSTTTKNSIAIKPSFHTIHIYFTWIISDIHPMITYLRFLCGYWHLKTGREGGMKRGKKEGRELGRERVWWFRSNTQEQRQHPVETQLAFQTEYTCADFEEKW